MKTIYISVPMRGRTEEAIAADVKNAIDYCKRHIAILGHKLVLIEPQGLAASLRKMVKEPSELDYYRLLTFDLEILLRECDSAAFCAGWEQSQGCRLEHAAAEIYGKEIIYL